MLSEEEAHGLVVWNAIQHDSNLLEGVTVGELSDLIAIVSKILEQEVDVLRSVPVGLMLRLAKTSDSVADNFENMRELLRVGRVRQALTERAKESG